jgi:hypothetical protein
MNTARAHDPFDEGRFADLLTDMKQAVFVGELGRFIDKNDGIKVTQRHGRPAPMGGNSATHSVASSSLSPRLTEVSLSEVNSLSSAGLVAPLTSPPFPTALE